MGQGKVKLAVEGVNPAVMVHAYPVQQLSPWLFFLLRHAPAKLLMLVQGYPLWGRMLTEGKGDLNPLSPPPKPPTIPTRPQPDSVPAFSMRPHQTGGENRIGP